VLSQKEKGWQTPSLFFLAGAEDATKSRARNARRGEFAERICAEKDA
jgi:hypothetical protein